MATALLIDPRLDQAPVPQTKSTKPPRPPHGVTVVFLDEFEVGSELMVEIDRRDVMTASLRANGLEASGSAKTRIREFRDGSILALADIPLVGHDGLARRSATGHVNIGLTIGPSVPGGTATVVASALAEGDWTGGLLRFSKVARHNLDRRAIWLSSAARQLHDWSGAGDGESTRLRWH